jgi:hypothetical protein
VKDKEIITLRKVERMVGYSPASTNCQHPDRDLDSENTDERTSLDVLIICLNLLNFVARNVLAETV